MTIYTRTGDEGCTDRPGRQRVRKCDPQVEAGGALDELDAALGWTLCAAGGEQHEEIRETLKPIQAELMAAGALLAAAGTGGQPGVSLDDTAVARMERQIDAVWAKLPELTHFILPEGCELACRLHVCRAICRRVERRIVAAAELEGRIPAILLRHINRFSDLLFALARLANQQAGRPERAWRP